MGVVKRGDVWWVDFGDPIGSEPGYRRPALVASSDRFNRSRIATVTVVSVTSNLALAATPGNVEVDPGAAGLVTSSVVNVTQITVVDRARLIEFSGALGPEAMRRIDAGLRLTLGL